MPHHHFIVNILCFIGQSTRTSPIIVNLHFVEPYFLVLFKEKIFQVVFFPSFSLKPSNPFTQSILKMSSSTPPIFSQNLILCIANELVSFASPMEQASKAMDLAMRDLMEGGMDRTKTPDDVKALAEKCYPHINTTFALLKQVEKLLNIFDDENIIKAMRSNSSGANLDDSQIREQFEGLFDHCEYWRDFHTRVIEDIKCNKKVCRVMNAGAQASLLDGEPISPQLHGQNQLWARFQEHLRTAASDTGFDRVTPGLDRLSEPELKELE